MNHYTIIHRDGTERIVHARPANLPPLDIPQRAGPDHIGHTARMPGRGYRSAPPSPWTVRLLGYSLMLVLIATTAVLLW